jgi:poly(3-hydroxybutyrate) depolymerase
MKNLFLSLLVCLPFFVFASDWRETSYSTPDGALEVILFAPLQREDSEPRPLLLVLHGCAQTAKEMARNGHLLAAAVEHDFVVALPQVPNNGVYVGCWDYYGPEHTRDSRHSRPLLNLVEQLKNQEELRINEKMVFISGLSSGAGQAMVLGCLAPEIFAGVSAVAAPGLGTLASQLTSLPQSKDLFLPQVTQLCEALAGEHKAALKTQVTSVLYAKNDLVVNPEYGSVNEAMYKELYGLKLATTRNLEQFSGSRPRGEERLWQNAQEKAQLSVIEHESLGHRWPGGQGGRAVKYIHRASMDYPNYMMKFFRENSLR